MGKLLILLTLLCTLLTGCSAQQTILGNERLGEYKSILQGKRLGIYTNQTGVDSALRPSVDTLSKNFTVTGIFVPEHGFYGAIGAGKDVSDAKYKNLPIYSVYGKTRHLTPEMLATFDALCVDIQDIGARHYTYFSSLAYLMADCAKADKEVIIFDRPNPLGGAMEGPVIKKHLTSFIGLYPIPLRHGLTIGEFARYINAEHGINCKLTVIPMRKWRRSMLYAETGLPFVPTSPNIPTLKAATLYLVTGSAATANVENGWGTGQPFQFLGLRSVPPVAVYEAFTALKIPGVAYRMAYLPLLPHHKGEPVGGVEIYLTDPHKVNLPELAFQLFQTLRSLSKEEMVFIPRKGFANMYKSDIAWGEESLREGGDIKVIFPRWKKECEEFAKVVKPYLLYK